MENTNTTSQPVRPGTGEHILQAQYGTEKRAQAFYDNQVTPRLNSAMQAFIARMELMFVSTADGLGRADCSVRAGMPGFVRVVDETTVAYPEYRGNGVMASLGNLLENPHIGLLFLDLTGSTVGLHVNGRAEIWDNDALLSDPSMPAIIKRDILHPDGHLPERFVVVRVDEAYIHCSKHLPLYQRAEKTIVWGTDDNLLKGGDYFGVSASRRE